MDAGSTGLDGCRRDGNARESGVNLYCCCRAIAFCRDDAAIGVVVHAGSTENQNRERAGPREHVADVVRHRPVPARAANQIARRGIAGDVRANIGEIVRVDAGHLHAPEAIGDRWHGDDHRLRADVQPSHGVKGVVIRRAFRSV
jgi:hypothetical protein